ncbi:MAG: hypothetical protein ACSHW0_18045 [Thalassotalea sp.]
MKLSVVIHTEEEFDWDGGFYRSNNQVSHGKELYQFCEQILELNTHLVLAMDYAFVSSDEGQELIKKCKTNKSNNLEFATHLHPWVNPPFDSNIDKVAELNSYPGNLSYQLECDKLAALTNKITELTNIQPKTYLAGRYGVGENSYRILKELGYETDLSISAFANFTHQQGPNFSQYTNNVVYKDEIKCIPHTTGYISHIKAFSNYLNNTADALSRLNHSLFGKVILKLLGVKRVRLSPEGFTFKEMKKLTLSLLAIGIEEFIFSFHSPSVKVGLTPYVQTKTQLAKFTSDTFQYLKWFQALNK